MAKNKINDLRDHLFETLEALKDPDKPMELDRAKAIAHVAQTIIDSARVEVDLVKAVHGLSAGSQFFGTIAEESREVPKIPRRDEPRQIAVAKAGS
ncbi:MAG: hypothetical protein ABI995_14760 [Acidobacteriota bacterium]